MVRASKNYQVKNCPCCDGHGIGRLASGTAWECTNCDGRGKVMSYPGPAPQGFLHGPEPRLDRG